MAIFLKNAAGKFLTIGGKLLKLPPKPLAVFSAMGGGSVSVKLSDGTTDTFYIDPIAASTLRYDDEDGFTFGCESGTLLCGYYYWDILGDLAGYCRQTGYNWIGSDSGDEFDFPARLIIYETPYDDGDVFQNEFGFAEDYFRAHNIKPIVVFDFVPGVTELDGYWQQRLDNPALQVDE